MILHSAARIDIGCCSKSKIRFATFQEEKTTATKTCQSTIEEISKQNKSQNYVNTLPVLTGRFLRIASCLHRVTSSFFLTFISSCAVELIPLSTSSPERASFVVQLCNLAIGKCADAFGNLLRISFSTLAKSLIVSKSKCLV